MKDIYVGGRRGRRLPFSFRTVVCGALALLSLCALLFALPRCSEKPEEAVAPAADAGGGGGASPVPLSATGGEGGAEAADAKGGDAAAPIATSKRIASALDRASAASGTVSFSLDAYGAASLSPVDDAGVTAALDAFSDAGYSAGFVACDLSTGSGIAENAGGFFFSASTIKGPYVAYLSTLLDSGEADADDVIVEDMVVEGTGIMAFDGQTSYDLETVAANTILHSDNTGYALLRERFGSAGFDEWAAACGVDAASWAGTWYPYCRPVDLAKLWLGMRDYFASGSGNAAWCEGLFSRTGTSFIREALGDRFEVLAKAGYEMDTAAYDMGSLNDAGLVRMADGGMFLVAIMSDADYDDAYYTENQHLIVDLARAAVSACGRLAL